MYYEMEMQVRSDFDREEGRKQGLEQGLERGKAESVMKLMKNAHIDIDAAMDMLELEGEDRDSVSDYLNQSGQ